MRRTMTGAELKAIRARLGMDALEFARWLGYRGPDSTVVRTLRRYENGHKPVPFVLTEADIRAAERELVHRRLSGQS